MVSEEEHALFAITNPLLLMQKPYIDVIALLFLPL